MPKTGPTASEEMAKSAGTPTLIGPVDEYKTLRDELSEAKKYAFERPIVIAGVAGAALHFVQRPEALFIPLALAGVTAFNLWFTANRLMSAARICAYIQVVLEAPDGPLWIGWERSLRMYRLWISERSGNPQERPFWKAWGFFEETRTLAHDQVDEKLQKEKVPDSLTYYPAIYVFHALLMVVAITMAIVYTVPVRDVWTVLSRVSCAATVGIAIVSLRYFSIRRPSNLSACMERNRVIWGFALSHLSKGLGVTRPIECKDSAEGSRHSAYRYGAKLAGNRRRF